MEQQTTSPVIQWFSVPCLLAPVSSSLGSVWSEHSSGSACSTCVKDRLSHYRLLNMSHVNSLLTPHSGHSTCYLGKTFPSWASGDSVPAAPWGPEGEVSQCIPCHPYSSMEPHASHEIYRNKNITLKYPINSELGPSGPVRIVVRWIWLCIVAFLMYRSHDLYVNRDQNGSNASNRTIVYKKKLLICSAIQVYLKKI